MTSAISTLFMGSASFAIPSLKALHLSPLYHLKGVYSRPPQTRKNAHLATPVHRFAQEHNLPLFTPPSLKTQDAFQTFASLKPELVIVIAYGLLLPPSFLALPTKHCLNLHPSLLPRWRGPCPIPHTLLNGDRTIGQTLIIMDKGTDTGAIIAQQSFLRPLSATTEQITDFLAQAAPTFLLHSLNSYQQGHLIPTPQREEESSTAPIVTFQQTRLDFRKPAQNLYNLFLAFGKEPGVWFQARKEVIKVLNCSLKGDVQANVGEVLQGGQVVCGQGSLQLKTLQRASKNPQNIQEFLRGFPLLGQTLL